MDQRNASRRLAVATIAVVLVALGGCGNREPAQAAGTSIQLALEGALPPHVQAAPEVVRVAYRFALANREVLQQVPCHCGCGSMGHGSNAACYLTAASTERAPVFDTHALGCSICVDITQDVMRLMRQGRTLAEIRSYVDTTYAQYGPSNLR